jgi:ubiquinone/menaquinone biosynthesis C-methylase UbiE
MALSEVEIARYRQMAAEARDSERDAWIAAGIVPGARIADIGCGPAAMLVELANVVGSGGRVDGIESDSKARAAAEQMVAGARLRNARILAGEATASGLEAGTYDAVMMRHVLLHNGSKVQVILAHLATLLRPRGCLFLVETDPLGWRRDPDDSDIADCYERWFALMRHRGNDLRIGEKLGRLLVEHGLELIDRFARYMRGPVGEDYWRGGPWAARQALVDAGLATNDDVGRWDAAFSRLFSLPSDRVFFTPFYRAIGMRAR